MAFGAEEVAVGLAVGAQMVCSGGDLAILVAMVEHVSKPPVSGDWHSRTEESTSAVGIVVAAVGRDPAVWAIPMANGTGFR